MWKCAKCSEKVDDDFEVCWNCGTSSEGIEDPAFRRADQIRADEMESIPPLANPQPVLDESTAIREVPHDVSVGREMRESSELLCLRCGREIDFVGTKSFHEGFQWGGLLGDWGEFLVNQESFDVYACRKCGHVEFFVSGVGEKYRRHKKRE